MLENEEIEWKQSSLQITLIFSYSLVWQNLKYFERRLWGGTKAMFSFANSYVLKANENNRFEFSDQKIDNFDL